MIKNMYENIPSVITIINKKNNKSVWNYGNFMAVITNVILRAGNYDRKNYRFYGCNYDPYYGFNFIVVIAPPPSVSSQTVK